MDKWTIYFITYITYSLLHAIRTSWESLKRTLEKEPFHFSYSFLGFLDMSALFTLAVSLYLFGHKVQRYPRRKLLFPTLFAGIISLTCLNLGLKSGVTNPLFYILFYGSGGVFTCMGWPICLYTMSLYFRNDHPTANSMWNSVSQFGDSIAFLVSIFVVSVLKIEPYNSLIALAFLLGAMAIIDYKFFIEPKNNQSTQHLNKQQFEKNQQNSVNFLNVWLIPGVALPVLAFSIVKSINAIIISWLILYLDKIGMEREARMLALLWACSIVGGGYIGSRLNNNHSYQKFIMCLVIASVLFFMLNSMNSHPKTFGQIILIIASAILVGSPYNQLGTAVPLKLGERKDIKNRPGARAAIMSLMESCGQFMCGMSVLIVPAFGVLKLNSLAATFCLLAIILLVSQLVRARIYPLQIDAQQVNEPVELQMVRKSKNSLQQQLLQK